MATAAVRGRLSWQLAEVLATIDETPTVRTLRLRVDDWPGHRPGQHVDVRLTAPDGYIAQRSYSIATPARTTATGDGMIDITVERLDDGEVSPYLNGVVGIGDQLELRGPIGGYFVWEPALGPEPVLLVGGGSGVVPLMAMIRARAHSVAAATSASDAVPMRLLLSSRTHDEIIYRTELDELAARGDGFELVHTLTRGAPDGWAGRTGRVDAALLAAVAWPPTAGARVFVCGPTPFVEVVASGLVGLGHARETIRTERFGATGAP
jgi:ferredoxin-NADP reductase